MFYLVLLFFISNISYADTKKVDVNMFYSDLHKSEIVEVTDGCGKQHVLQISKNDLFKREKIDRWFKQLVDFNIYQDCD